MNIHAPVFLLDANVERFFDFGLEVVPVDQELGDRAAHKARQHQPKGRAGDTDLRCATDAVFFGKDGCPRDRGTVATDE